MSSFLKVAVWLLAGVSLFACGRPGIDASFEDLRKARASLRAYDGAPPVVPHEVTGAIYRRCLYCHEKGRVLGDVLAGATPHPEMKNCLQCHVIRQTGDLFTRNDFEPFRITGSLPGKNPAGPGLITHRLQMRENCKACHLGETAAKALKPRHGERQNCTQCHIHPELPEKDFPHENDGD